MNKKYKPIQKTTKKQKMSFEKKIILQGCISLIILIYCVIISNTNYFPAQKQFLHKAVNITSDKQDIKNMFDGGHKFIRYLSGKGSIYFDALIGFFDSGINKEDIGIQVSASEHNPNAVYSLPENPPKNQEQTNEQPPEGQPQFRYPAEGEITSKFGSREHPINGTQATHYGVDIAANHGDCVIASLPGTVTDTGFDANLGNYVKIKHSDNMETVYGHMSEIMVKKDEAVDSNTRIGSVGSTGAATGPHVHLEVRIDGVCQDPENYLPKN